MASVKKFFKYILLIVLCYFMVSGFSALYMMKTYKNLNDYEIVSENPKIEIVEGKATFVNGYIKGQIKNTTSKDIEKGYIKIDLYSKSNNLLETNYVEIDGFEQNSLKEFKSDFKCDGVKNYKIGFVNEISEEVKEEKTWVNAIFNEIPFIGVAGIVLLFVLKVI